MHSKYEYGIGQKNNQFNRKNVEEEVYDSLPKVTMKNRSVPGVYKERGPRRDILLVNDGTQHYIDLGDFTLVELELLKKFISLSEGNSARRSSLEDEKKAEQGPEVAKAKRMIAGIRRRRGNGWRLPSELKDSIYAAIEQGKEAKLDSGRRRKMQQNHWPYDEKTEAANARHAEKVQLYDDEKRHERRLAGSSKGAGYRTELWFQQLNQQSLARMNLTRKEITALNNDGVFDRLLSVRLMNEQTLAEMRRKPLPVNSQDKRGAVQNEYSNSWKDRIEMEREVARKLSGHYIKMLLMIEQQLSTVEQVEKATKLRSLMREAKIKYDANTGLYEFIIVTPMSRPRAK